MSEKASYAERIWKEVTERAHITYHGAMGMGALAASVTADPAGIVKSYYLKEFSSELSQKYSAPTVASDLIDTLKTGDFARSFQEVGGPPDRALCFVGGTIVGGAIPIAFFWGVAPQLWYPCVAATALMDAGREYKRYLSRKQRENNLLREAEGVIVKEITDEEADELEARMEARRKSVTG